MSNPNQKEIAEIKSRIEEIKRFIQTDQIFINKSILAGDYEMAYLDSKIIVLWINKLRDLQLSLNAFNQT